MNEYLANRQKFTLPTLVFRPSSEKIDELLYYSPLTQEKPPTAAAPKSPAGSLNDKQQILTINEDASLQELINKIEFI